MARTHANLGCLCCGKRRRTEDIMSKRYDVYLKDKTSRTLMRVGLCPACFDERETLCLVTMQKNLETSEVDRCKQQGRCESLAQKFKDAKFCGLKSHAEFWNEAAAKVCKKATDYTEIVNERN